MSKRASLPGASELFRLTGGGSTVETAPISERPTPERKASNSGNHNGQARRQFVQDDAAARRGSGRQKHDAKITVYVSGDELVAMEHARLTLRAQHKLAVDRGRLVREAVAVLLADFEERGDDSVLVQRLRDGALGAVGGNSE